MDNATIKAFKIISSEVEALQNRFSSAYTNAIADDGTTTVTLDLEDLNYIIFFALKDYQHSLQEVIIHGQD